jgi:hypothetical protein
MLRRALGSSSQKTKSQIRPRKSPSRCFSFAILFFRRRHQPRRPPPPNSKAMPGIHPRNARNSSRFPFRRNLWRARVLPKRSPDLTSPWQGRTAETPPLLSFGRRGRSARSFLGKRTATSPLSRRRRWRARHLRRGARLCRRHRKWHGRGSWNWLWSCW